MLFEEIWIKFLEDSFLNYSTEVLLEDIILISFWSILLSFIIAITYRSTHRGVSYSQSFTQTLVLLGFVVSIIMVVVGTSIARAFTLIGAFAIVRFRNAVRDSRDVGFVFFVLVMGMACGTRIFPLAIIGTLTGCGILYLMTYFNFGQKGIAQDILEMHFPISEDYGEILSPILRRYLKYFSVLSIDSVDEKLNRISFIVTFKKKPKKVKKKGRAFEGVDSKSSLLSELQSIKYISNVKIIGGSASVEI